MLSAPSPAREAAAAGTPVLSHGTRLQSLDGLRAISIMLVMLAHLGGTSGFPFSDAVTNYADLGGTGVSVFFTISGFLITSLLLDEHERTGTISLKGFYFRRTLRIFPAYYAFLAMAVILRRWGVADSPDTAFLMGLTYTSNYLPDRGWLLGHTWSLAVEEQFYLLWPAVVLLAGPRRAMGAALAVVLASPVIRLASWYAGPLQRELIGTSFQTVMDSIAIGCALAGARRGLISIPRFERLFSGRYVVPAFLVLVALAPIDRPRFAALIGTSMRNLAIAMVLDHALRTREGWWIRFLNTRVMAYIGTISYSLYLWQQPFLNRTVIREWTTFPANLTLATLLALASHYVVERPGLRLRRSLERRLGPAGARGH